MKRIASLSILFAALIEFAIEHARFDLWIATAAIVTLLWNLVGRALRALSTHGATIQSRGSMPLPSPTPRKSAGC
jgi:hypothetical protein